MSIYMTFSNSMRFNKRFQTTENIYHDMRFVIEQMSKDLENIAPYKETIDYGTRQEVIVGARTSRNVPIELKRIFEGQQDASGVFFKGTSRDVTFIVASPKGLRQVSYYLSEPENLDIHQTLVDYFSGKNRPITTTVTAERPKTMLLVREVRPFPYGDLKDIRDETEIEILSSHVLEGSLKLSYAFLEAKSQLNEVLWEDLWDKNYFPVGIRLDVSFVIPQGDNKISTIQKKLLIPLGLAPAYAGQDNI